MSSAIDQCMCGHSLSAHHWATREGGVEVVSSANCSRTACGCAEYRDVRNIPREAETDPAAARRKLLATAEKNVCGQRTTDYGTPESSFTVIAGIWSAMFGREFTAAEVAMALAALKLARLTSNPGHADSWVDLAGYAACGFEVSGGELP